MGIELNQNKNPKQQQTATKQKTRMLQGETGFEKIFVSMADIYFSVYKSLSNYIATLLDLFSSHD